MKIATYQAPLLAPNTTQIIKHIKRQIDICESEGVEILCCPETVLGGLADNVDTPSDLAIQIENGELEELLSPLISQTVTLIIGFTETTPAGTLYNTAAIVHKGKINGCYRKVYPAINSSVYTAGDQLPTFTIGALKFGIIICNDTNYYEPARVIASQGAAALFIPTNNALPPHRADAITREMVRNKHIARAVENGMYVICADVAGQNDQHISHGCTNIIDPNGQVIASSQCMSEDLLIADIETKSDTFLRGWDATKNPAVIQAYIQHCYPDHHP